MAVSYTQRLRESVQNGEVMLILGTGVSISATTSPVPDQETCDPQPCASWTGLIQDGIDWYVQREGTTRPWVEIGQWKNRMEELVNQRDLQSLLAAATELERVLGGTSSPEFARWINQSIGALRVINPAVLNAVGHLAQCGVRLATTNYDGLLEETIGYQPVTWDDVNQAERVLRDTSARVVLHLHGFWRSPKSLVFGTRSYDRVRANAHVQTILRASRTLKTIVFVGSGYDGLADPNLGRFIDWSRETLRGSESEHFFVASPDELEEMRLRLIDDNLFPVSFATDDCEPQSNDSDATDEESDAPSTNGDDSTDDADAPRENVFNRLPGFLTSLDPCAQLVPFWTSFARRGSKVKLLISQCGVRRNVLANLTSASDIAGLREADLKKMGYKVSRYAYCSWEEKSRNTGFHCENENLIVLGSPRYNRICGKVLDEINSDRRDLENGKDAEECLLELLDEWFENVKFRPDDEGFERPSIKDAPTIIDDDRIAGERYRTWAALIQTRNPYDHSHKALIATSDSPAGNYAALCRETLQELLDEMQPFDAEFAAVFEVAVTVGNFSSSQESHPSVVDHARLVAYYLPRFGKGKAKSLNRDWIKITDPLAEAQVC